MFAEAGIVHVWLSRTDMVAASSISETSKQGGMAKRKLIESPQLVLRCHMVVGIGMQARQLSRSSPEKRNGKL